MRRCLVADNRAFGVIAAGVPAEIEDTVVIRTAARASDQSLGTGIAAQCYLTAGCGSLTVRRSLVADNRAAGISGLGVATEVEDTIVTRTAASGAG